jgi:IclR family transcriptional regulator, acetate operon repressor
MAGAATVEKALDVLFHLHAAETAQGLGQIAGALGLAKSSCHRLLASLVEREVVEQDEGGRYRPGLALLALGLGAQRREPVVELARPALESEADELGETVFLVAARRGRLRVLDKCEGSGFLRAAPGIGDVIPGDVTAAGKLYAAHAEAGAA